MMSISIHALREEGDRKRLRRRAAGTWISIHALREEGDILIGALMMPALPFLSTPSVRRATIAAGKAHPYHLFLSTPSVRRATW